MGSPLGTRGMSFRADANKRIHKFTVLTKSTVNTSDQLNVFAAIPGGANAAGVMGVTPEHFVEPNYFVKEGTDPTTVTGTTPTLYDLTNRPIPCLLSGEIARCIAAGTIAQDDEVNVADSYGRIKKVNEAAGTEVHVVGRALHGVSAANDIVRVALNFYVKKT